MGVCGSRRLFLFKGDKEFREFREFKEFWEFKTYVSSCRRNSGIRYCPELLELPELLVSLFTKSKQKHQKYPCFWAEMSFLHFYI